jgi:hypothetical protein
LIFPLCWEIKNAPSGESIDHTFLGAFERRTAQQSANDNRQVDELERARWLVFIGAYVRCLIRTWMKIYVICHTCVHVFFDTIAVRVDVIITSVGVYVIRVVRQILWEEQCLLSISNIFTLLNSDTLLSLSLVQAC